MEISTIFQCLLAFFSVIKLLFQVVVSFATNSIPNLGAACSNHAGGTNEYKHLRPFGCKCFLDLAEL